MDRFDLCVILAASPTIVIEPYIILGAGVVVVVGTILLISKPAMTIMAACKRRKAAVKKRKKEELQKELSKLFPEPWLSVFNECKKMDKYLGRMILFNAWLNQNTERTEELPRLSMDAIYRMAKMVARSDTDSDFRTIAEKLSPYLAFKNGTPSTKKPPQPSQPIRYARHGYPYYEGFPAGISTHKDTETLPLSDAVIQGLRDHPPGQRNKFEDGCERHPDVQIINNCHQCGAPQCCPACCNEVMIEDGRCGSHAILGQHAKFDDNCCLCGVPIRQGELQCCSACHKNPRAPVEKIMHTENYVAPACCPMCDCPGNDCDCVAKILADARD